MRTLLGALALLTTPALAVDANSTDPQAIMAAVEDRAEGDKVKAKMSIVITDRAGRERTRVVQTRAIDFAGGRKQLMIFESPADVRNTGLLSVDYDDGGKDDDQWLYLPSLNKSTRISSGDRSGSFMGTDLSYADMTRADPKHYEYTIIQQSAQVDGAECWLMESRPKTDKARTETGYLKSHIWVDKKRLMPLQVKAWVRKGKKLKFIKFGDIKVIEGLNIPHKISAMTKRGKKRESTTVIQFSNFSLNNADVSDEGFNQRALEKGLQ